jgi:hypothetical protein
MVYLLYLYLGQPGGIIEDSVVTDSEIHGLLILPAAVSLMPWAVKKSLQHGCLISSRVAERAVMLLGELVGIVGL